MFFGVYPSLLYTPDPPMIRKVLGVKDENIVSPLSNVLKSTGNIET